MTAPRRPDTTRDALVPIIAELRQEIADAANALAAWLNMTGAAVAATTINATRDRLLAALDIGRGLRPGGAPADVPWKELQDWRVAVDRLGVGELDSAELRAAIAEVAKLWSERPGGAGAAADPTDRDGGSDLPSEFWAALHRWRLATDAWNEEKYPLSSRGKRAASDLKAVVAGVHRATVALRASPAGGPTGDWLDWAQRLATHGRHAPGCNTSIEGQTPEASSCGCGWRQVYRQFREARRNDLVKAL